MSYVPSLKSNVTPCEFEMVYIPHVMPLSVTAPNLSRGSSHSLSELLRKKRSSL